MSTDGTQSSAPLPFCWPNGLGFSPGGDVLYFADYATGVVHRSRWSGAVADVVLVERIAVPDEFVSSCCFWPGRDRLVITTGTGVFSHDLG